MTHKILNSPPQGTRLGGGEGAAGAVTEDFSFFAHREAMGKKNSVMEGRDKASILSCA
jgi:hypothetical protein